MPIAPQPNMPIPSSREAIEEEIARIQQDMAQLEKTNKLVMSALSAAQNGLVSPIELTASLSGGDMYTTAERLDRLLDMSIKRRQAEEAGENTSWFMAAGKAMADVMARTGAGLSRLGSGLFDSLAHTLPTREPHELAYGNDQARTQMEGQRRADALSGKYHAEAGKNALGLVPFGTAIGEWATGKDLQPTNRETPNIDALEQSIYNALGMPEDPIARDVYREALPKTWRYAGEMAGVLAMILATRKLAPPAGQGTIAASTAVGGRISRGVLPVAAGAGLGVSLGLDIYANPEGDTFDRVNAAMRGVAAPFLLLGLLRGTPYGTVARRLHQAEQAKQLGSLRRLGQAMSTSPYLTTGHMLQSTLIGASLGAAEASNAGAPPGDAVLAGIQNGLMWLGTDVVATRLGGVARWSRTLTNVQQTAINKILEWGITPKIAKAMGTTPNQVASVGGALANAGAKAPHTLAGLAAGAAAGAAAAAASDLDPRYGAVVGAGIGLMKMRSWLAVQSILPEEIVKIIEAGQLHKLSGEQLGEVAAAALRQSIEEVAAETPDDAMRVVLQHATARDITNSQDERLLHAELTRLTAEIQSIMPGEQLPVDGHSLSQLFQRARRVSEIHERLAQILKERYADVEPGAQADAAASTARGLASRADLQIQANKDAIERARVVREQRVAASEKLEQNRLAARDAAQEAEDFLTESAPIRRSFNLRFNAAMENIAETLTPAGIYDEISKATGETVDAIRARLGHSNIHGAISDLALLRASAGHPGKAITSPIIRREGTTQEFRKAVEQLRTLDDELATLLRDVNSGQEVSPQRLRAALKRAGGGTVVKEGSYWRITFPFAGEIVDNIPSAMRRARINLKDYVPGIVLIGPNMDMKTDEEGNLRFTDEDGNKGLAFVGNVAAAASLAAVGIVLKKGMPIRYKGMVRQMRYWLNAQSERFGKINDEDLIYGREALIAFWADGKATVNRGSATTVPVPERLWGIIFSLHNHPRALEGNPLFTRARNFWSAYPSPGDLEYALHHNRNAMDTASLAVVTPRTGEITVAGLPRDMSPAVAKATWDKATRNAIILMGQTLGMRGKQSPEGILGQFIAQHGDGIAHAAFEAEFAKAFPDGALVRNVTDEALERYLAHRLDSAATRRAGVARSPLAQLVDNDVAEFFGAGHVDTLTEPVTKLLTDKAWSQKLRELFLGPEPAAKPVARAGAGAVKRILPTSVTPTAASRPGLTLESMQGWAKAHGMTLATAPATDGITFTLLHQGQTVATGNTLRDLRAQVMDLAKRDADNATRVKLGMGERLRKGFFDDPQAGATRAEAQVAQAATTGLGLSGAVAGTMLGGLLQNYYRNRTGSYDEDPPYQAMALGALLGGALGTWTGLKLAGFKVKPAVERALRFYATPVEDQYTSHVVEKMMGKGSPHTVVVDGKSKRVYPGGPTKRDFFHFPVADQVRHLKLRLKDTINTVNISQEDKQARFKRTLAKFTPSHLTDKLYDDLFAEVVGMSQAAGFTREQASHLWMGMLLNMALPYTIRAPRRVQPDLMLMARDFSSHFGINDADFEAMRRLVATTQVLSGRDAPKPRAAKDAARQSMRASVDSQEFKALHDVFMLSDINMRQADQFMQTSWAAGLRSPEQFVTIGNKLKGIPGKEAIGDDILRFHRSMMMSAENIRTEEVFYTRLMMRIFKGVSLADRKLVRGVLEDEATAQQVFRDNPVLYEKIMAYKTQVIDAWADRLGLPKENRIERYYMHIYNTRTIEQLRLNKFVGSQDTMYVPWGSGISEYKVMKNMLSRSFESPIGEIIEDPLEAGRIYIHGAARKFHLDRMAAIYNNDWFKQMAHNEPFVAREMARWMLDIWGVPSTMHLKIMARFHQWGLRLDDIAAQMNLPAGGFIRDVIDRYFLSEGGGGRFINFVRNAEFYAKLGGSFIGALVNLSQLGNTGTDLGLSSMLLGGIPYTIHAGVIGKAADALEERGFQKLAGFIDPHASGRKKLTLARNYGVWSDNTKNMLDQLDAIQFIERGGSVPMTLMSSLGGGLASAAFFGDEEGHSMPFGLGNLPGRQAEFGAGAIAGAAVTVMPLGARAVRRMLMITKSSIIAPFEFAEFINRGMAGGTALREARIARASRGSPTRAAVARLGEAAENISVGTGTGALFGRVSAEPGEEGSATRTGALLGATAGAGIAFAGRKAPRINRVNAELDWLTDNSGALPWRKILHEQATPTEQEISHWYMRQVLDQTQFRFGREARGRYLRTPTGEILGALQSFTINQMEFAGQRLSSMFRSITSAAPEGATSKMLSGEVDTRFFRHMMLVMSAGAALTSLTASLDIDKGIEYWMSRVGFGLLPVIHWNEDAEVWQIGDIGAHVQGPVVTDILNAFKTIKTLITNPVASANWDVQLDNLARRIYTALRQMEAMPETVGKMAEKLGLEGLKEMALEQQQAATTATHPVSTVRRGQPETAMPRSGGGGGRSGGAWGSGGGSGGAWD